MQEASETDALRLWGIQATHVVRVSIMPAAGAFFKSGSEFQIADLTEQPVLKSSQQIYSVRGRSFASAAREGVAEGALLFHQVAVVGGVILWRTKMSD